MRPHPNRCLPALLVLLLSFAGCSEKAARITGNERLARGVEGLGTTERGDTLVDRDTYVPPTGTTLRGATLLIGRRGSYEARSLFRVKDWKLPPPDSMDILSAALQLEFDPKINEDLPAGGTAVDLHEAGAAWDSTSVEWPGPPLGALLGSGVDDLAPLTLALDPVAFDSARVDTTGFVLALGTGNGVRGFRAGSGHFQVVYRRIFVGDTISADIPIPTDVTIHAPLAPAAGTESQLVLGGYFRAEALLHAPAPVPPPGFSINGAAIVAYLESPAFPADESVEIRAYRIRNAWTEGVAADSGLGLDAVPLATLSGYRVRSAGDSLTIPIPVSVAREWSVNPASNEGILLRVTDSFYAPEIRLFSHESARPPVLRLSTTTPPPGRF